MKYMMQFNEKTTCDFDIVMYDYATYTGGTKYYDSTPIAGRIGELVGTDNYKGNMTVQCIFSLIGKSTMQKIRSIKEWLTGMGMLKFSDAPETFYRVLKVDYGEIQREVERYGRFIVSFLCIPYEFREDGRFEYKASEISNNPYARCNPIYKIKGEGVCNLTVNDHTMTANVGQNLTINSDLMIAYREDGTIQNTSVVGDYELLRLQKGKVDISITDGFDLRIIPNWGYDI